VVGEQKTGKEMRSVKEQEVSEEREEGEQQDTRDKVV
jgi:hypothetical protein